MSDTPRTDAQLEAWGGGDVAPVFTALADFARALERELAEATRDAARYRWVRDSISFILEDEAGVAGAAYSYQIPLDMIEKLDESELLDAVADAGIEMDAPEPVAEGEDIGK